MFTDLEMSTFCDLLVKQFSEKEILMKVLLSKYLELKWMEKSSIKDVFNQKFKDLEDKWNEIGEEKYEKYYQDLKIWEENMFKDTDNKFDHLHAEEQACMKKILEKKHAKEQIDQKHEILEAKIKAYDELFGGRKMKDIEHEKKAF